MGLRPRASGRSVLHRTVPRDNRRDIHGAVLEVKDSAYSQRFGTNCESFNVVDIVPRNDDATIIADLSQPDVLPDGRFDSFVLTQTIHLIYEAEEVVRNAFRTLRPGGVLLATLPCVSRIDYESGLSGDVWRFTLASSRRLFESVFGEGNIEVQSFGNVLACTAFIQGLAVEDLDREELDHQDPYFPLLIAVRAVKPRPWPVTAEVGLLEGFHEVASCSEIAGWAWDPTDPDRRLRVDISAGGVKLGSAWADRYRPDLKGAGKDDGRLSFAWIPPDDLHQWTSAPIRVTLAGTDEALAATPRPLECRCERDNRVALARRRESKGAVLLYHRIAFDTDGTQKLSTAPDVFRSHMALVAERYVSMPLAKLVSSAAEGRLPPGAVSITFDDGYVDNLEVAVPILTEFGIPATFFIITRPLEEPVEPWWDLLERTLRFDDGLPEKLWVDTRDEKLRLPTKTMAERRLALHVLLDLMMKAELDQREAVIEQVVEWSGNRAKPSTRLMSAEEVARLAALPGHEIGAHTVNQSPVTGPAPRRDQA